jgi:hypothetical protein
MIVGSDDRIIVNLKELLWWGVLDGLLIHYLISLCKLKTDENLKVWMSTLQV